MVLFIRRFKDIKDGTVGEFLLKNDDQKVLLRGYTLEPAGPDTVTPNKDRRIPAGVYGAIWSFSPSFQETLPLLFNDVVPKSRRILIHAGNYPKDTLGCILLGSSFNGEGVMQSKKKMSEFLNIAKNTDFKVIIENSQEVG